MAREYKPGDQVAIKRTQFKTSAKILPKYLGAYEVIKKIGNDRYDVKKIGTHDGPRTIKSCAEMMKPWCQEDLDGSESRKKNRGFPFKKSIDDVITRKQMTAWNFLW
jgi:hypothetical protein